AKIAYRLSQGSQGMAAEMFGGTFATRRKVMMASLDTRRPAAQQQLAVLGEQTGVPTLPIVPLEMPLAITRRALETARREGFDVLILDTAGRLSIDEELMKEVADISDLAKPKETLLVADAMTGQDAVNVAKAFNDRLAGDGKPVVEGLGDIDRVLAGHRVGDQQGFLRLGEVADVGDLLHQLFVDRQPAGGVEDQDIEALAPRRLERPAGDCERHLERDDRQGRHAGLLAQHRELLLRGGTAGIERGHHHLAPGGEGAAEHLGRHALR